MRFFISAGEPSGDTHAAGLIKKIREHAPDAQFVGFGGPKMKEAGCQLLYDLTTLAVMWFLNVITNYLKFRRLIKKAEYILSTEQFDSVILVDYPGFNWHIARAAKENGIPVYYFMPPQVWAWAQHRVKKMRELVSTVLAPLPFEYRWFNYYGCKTVYIGHPFFEEMRRKEADAAFLEMFYKKYGNAPILTVLPGSRYQEVKANLDEMLLAIEYVRSMLPNVQPVLSPFNETQAKYISDRLKELELNIPVFTGKTTELIRAADCCLAVSGSVSLELLACNKPSVIYYRVKPLPLLFSRFFRRTRYITLVNLLGVDRLRDAKTKTPLMFYDESVKLIPAEPTMSDRNRMLFPEFLTAADRSKDAASYLIHYLSKPEHLAKQKRLLAVLLNSVDNVDSPLDTAARTILGIVKN